MQRFFKRLKLGQQDRRGATLVEMAVVLPVFGVFMAGVVEFGHLYMTINTLNAVARKAARYGVADGISTSQVQELAQQTIQKAFSTNNVLIDVKEAKLFDSSQVNTDTIDYNSLPTANLLEAEPRELFLVRISVPYDEVALLPPFWAKNLTLTGQSVMRHE